jgi:hypothetical protein
MGDSDQPHAIYALIGMTQMPFRKIPLRLMGEYYKHVIRQVLQMLENDNPNCGEDFVLNHSFENTRIPIERYENPPPEIFEHDISMLGMYDHYKMMRILRGEWKTEQQLFCIIDHYGYTGHCPICGNDFRDWDYDYHSVSYSIGPDDYDWNMVYGDTLKCTKCGYERPNISPTYVSKHELEEIRKKWKLEHGENQNEHQ